MTSKLCSTKSLEIFVKSLFWGVGGANTAWHYHEIKWKPTGEPLHSSQHSTHPSKPAKHWMCQSSFMIAVTASTATSILLPSVWNWRVNCEENRVCDWRHQLQKNAPGRDIARYVIYMAQSRSRAALLNPPIAAFVPFVPEAFFFKKKSFLGCSWQPSPIQRKHWHFLPQQKNL